MKTTTKPTRKATAPATQPAPNHSTICARGSAVETARKVAYSIAGLSEIMEGAQEVEVWGVGVNLGLLSGALLDAAETLSFLEREWEAALEKARAG